jgi:integrase
VVLNRLDGTMRLIVGLLYGAGLRLRECLELRVKDIDFATNQIVVRRARAGKIASPYDAVKCEPLAIRGDVKRRLRPGCHAEP